MTIEQSPFIAFFHFLAEETDRVGAIKVLEEEGITELSDLIHLTEKEVNEHLIPALRAAVPAFQKVGPASKFRAAVAAFKATATSPSPAPTAPADGGAMHTIAEALKALSTKPVEGMSLEELLSHAEKNGISREAAKRFAALGVFTVIANPMTKAVDFSETRKYIQNGTTLSDGTIWNARAKLGVVLIERLSTTVANVELDPLTKERLFDGVNTGTGTNWKPVTESVRAFVAWCASNEKNNLPHNGKGSKVVEDIVAAENNLDLLAKQKPDDWATPVFAWQMACSRFDPGELERHFIDRLYPSKEDGRGVPFAERVSENTPQPSALGGKSTLSGEERREFEAALASAFPSSSALSTFIAYKLGIRLNLIATEGTKLPSQIGEIVDWAEASGRLTQLIQGAREQNPGNPLLANFANTFFGIERTAIDPNQLREKLQCNYTTEAEARRVAHDAGMKTGRIDFGGSSANRWFSIIEEAKKSKCLENLSKILQKEYPDA